MLDLYRSLAGLMLLTMSAASNKLAQDCALLMHANDTITHTPPSSSKCDTAETYSVALTGTSMPIAYDVEVVDCR